MIKTDSRRIKKGDIFVALPGINDDGHNYIDDAIKNGASKIVALYGNYSVDTLIVDDTRKYLNNFLEKNYAHYFSDMTIIGVTGTNGKTTISSMIYQSLNKLGVNCSMVGTLGFYMKDFVYSLPNTCPDVALIYEMLIESYKNGFKCIVIEASSQGLVEERLHGVKFDYAIFINLTHDHLDYHGTISNYVSAKGKLFSQLKKGGKRIINIDDNFYKYFLSDNTITFGFNSSDYQIINYDNNSFDFIFNNKIYKFNHNLIGKYNIYNLMACMIVLFQMGFEYNSIYRISNNIKLPKGRMEVYKYLNNKIIVDYAHTPDAIKNVLSSISNYKKLYVVFGCTGNRDKIKRPIMTRMILDKCDYAIITCDDLYDESFNDIVSDMLLNNLNNNYCICYDRGKAIKKGIDLLDDNDILLILGKGHEQYLKIENKKILFNDGVEVLKNIGFDMKNI